MMYLWMQEMFARLHLHQNSLPNELFQTLVSNVLEDIREGEPINPQTQTYIRSVWASMSPDQKASLLNAEGQGPRVVQALEGTPNNVATLTRIA